MSVPQGTKDRPQKRLIEIMGQLRSPAYFTMSGEEVTALLDEATVLEKFLADPAPLDNHTSSES